MNARKHINTHIQRIQHTAHSTDGDSGGAGAAKEKAGGAAGDGTVAAIDDGDRVNANISDAASDAGDEEAPGRR